MDFDLDGDDSDVDYDPFASSLAKVSQRGSQVPGPPAVPGPSNVTNRRNNNEAMANGKDKSQPDDPANVNAPVNINKIRRVLFDSLGAIKKHKKDAMMTKKDCFENQLLENFASAADCLELEESGEFIKYSAIVYGLRVDTTYNDALSTNVQLQPSNEKEEELGKKSKAEQKTKASTVTQSLNLQKLNEMSVDEPDLRHKSATPEVLLEVVPTVRPPPDGFDGLLFSSDDEDEERREEELSEEQRRKEEDEKPFDSSFLTLDYLKTTSLKDVIKNEVAKRARNLNRKCSENPMLMDDESKYRMPPATILTNEYYQVATAHYKDLNASGMLSNNAKVTHNGRMTLMHKRMDMWTDDDASDETEPTLGFIFNVAGLLENALRPVPVAMRNELFDDCDRPVETKMSTGKDLQKIEKVARKKVLESDDLALLDEDGHGVHEEDKEVPSPKPSKDVVATAVGDEVSGPSRPESSASSVNRSTSAAETETSEPSKTEKEHEDQIKEDLGVLEGAPRKKKKATSYLSMLTDDEIPNCPELSVDYVAADFQKILSDKLAMKFEDITWRYGSVAEELQCDMAQIKDESQYVANASMDLDQMHLDKMWHSKFYKKKLTEEDVKEVKEKMMPLMSTEDFDKTRDYLRPGLTYQFFGEEDNWANPVIPPDEDPNFKDELIARPIEDESEKRRFEKTHGVRTLNEEIRSAAEEQAAVDDFERIVVDASILLSDNEDQMDNEDIGSGFLSDANANAADEAGPSSRPTEFTAGDDVRPDEVLGDVNMDQPVLPSLEVVTTGKADDSHWKGGKNAEKPAEPVKKERKKRKKRKARDDDDEEEEEESVVMKYFVNTGDVLDRAKIRNRFPQCEINVDVLMKTDHLLMPTQIITQPQLEYDATLFYKPFYLPNKLHSRYIYRNNEIVDKNEEVDECTVQLEPKVRMGHYAHMLEETVADKGRDADDVFMAFLREYKNFPGVNAQKEKEELEKQKELERAAEEAAAEELDSQDSDDVGIDDNDDREVDNDDNEGRSPREVKLERFSRSRSRSVGSTTRGYAIRVEGNNADDDEADAVATVGDRQYKLHLIKLDTVAMKTALSDVLTNPLMESERLDETLGHFDRAFPSQRPDEGKKKKKAKSPMQALYEDEEMEFDEHERRYVPDASHDELDEVDFEATMLEVPDAMNVTRALFAPPKVKVVENKEVMFGGAANSSQSRANKSVEHIHLKGHHTLKSAFTCLPARMPLGATSDVTVASTISMILHLANENNLILNQPGQYDGMNDDASTKSTTYGKWMNDFEVGPDHLTDKDGKQLRKSMQGISKSNEVLSSLTTSDAREPEKRPKAEKLLQKLAAVQEKDKMAAKAAAIRKKGAPGPSTSSSKTKEVLNGHEREQKEDHTVPGPSFKIPECQPSTSTGARRGTPRKHGNDQVEPDRASGKDGKQMRRSMQDLETADVDLSSQSTADDSRETDKRKNRTPKETEKHRKESPRAAATRKKDVPSTPSTSSAVKASNREDTESAVNGDAVPGPPFTVPASKPGSSSAATAKRGRPKKIVDEAEPDEIADKDDKQLRKRIKVITRSAEALCLASTADDDIEPVQLQIAAIKEIEKKKLQKAVKEHNEKMASRSAATRKNVAPGTSVIADSLKGAEQKKTSVQGRSPKVPPAGKPSTSTASPAKRTTPRKNGNDDSKPGPSTKRTRLF